MCSGGVGVEQLDARAQSRCKGRKCGCIGQGLSRTCHGAPVRCRCVCALSACEHTFIDTSALTHKNTHTHTHTHTHAHSRPHSFMCLLFCTIVFVGLAYLAARNFEAAAGCFIRADAEKCDLPHLVSKRDVAAYVAPLNTQHAFHVYIGRLSTRRESIWV